MMRIIVANLKIILKDDYAVIILSIISYIFFFFFFRIKYKKKIEFNKEFALVLFIIYLLILFFIVTYPVNEYGYNNYNLFRELLRYKIGSNGFINNVIGNILLFIPFGMFLRYYFKLKIISLIFITILYSLSIEVTQILINRVFDIDDIILNLIGAIIGYYFSKFSY